MIHSLNLLDPMGEVINVTGSPVRGAGWYGPNNGVHTVAIRVLNFRGRIRVQATLAVEPTDNDWFSVLPNNADYIQYPRQGFMVNMPSTGETSTYGFTFQSNVVWVRALVERDYIIPQLATLQYIATFGLVDYVMLNY